jgi:uncharacterized protein YdiU (UPF0061 family)
LDGWLRDWRERLASDPQAVAERIASMRAASPAFIPRNHRVQAALALEYMAQMAFRLDVIELGGAKQ